MLYYVRVLNMFKTQDTPLFYQECTIGVLPKMKCSENLTKFKTA